ncbi:hypothetical protein ASZ90_008879 [hydrocarbon metagenome]|uniref:Uncharacterized protein n=1 Tax=hydrocarbon metagenome TaxID=938273 RepID=A0A0W8FKG5_9ZZZZ
MSWEKKSFSAISRLCSRAIAASRSSQRRAGVPASALSSLVRAKTACSIAAVLTELIPEGVDAGAGVFVAATFCVGVDAMVCIAVGVDAGVAVDVASSNATQPAEQQMASEISRIADSFRIGEVMRPIAIIGILIWSRRTHQSAEMG